MVASIPSAVVLGVDGHPVSVEVHVGPGLPSFTVVGLPDAACREARDRVRAAIQSSGYRWPPTRITVNLAPTALPKVGASLDLAIALGILVESEVVDAGAVARLGVLGELGLDGSVRTVTGMVPMVDAIGTAVVVVPAAGTTEARLVARHEIRPVRHLRELVEALDGSPWPPPPPPGDPPFELPGPDLADVRGQPTARLALEVAAAGGHHLLMVGPPGAGKTMLASRLPGLLPPLERDAALEVTKVHSAAGVTLPAGGLVQRPPLRSPHHSATVVALVGGGSAGLRPGEISCAHRGVLFLDELAEFPPSLLDQLRQPLEEGLIRIARARATVTFPARFLLVAAMNPCPCGAPRGPSSCRCAEARRRRYRRRVSGPLLDRFDLRISVPKPEPSDLLRASRAETSATVADRVCRARAMAAERGVSCNADLIGATLERHAPLDPAARRLLERQVERGRLSGRGVVRLRRVARTLADLRGGAEVLSEELLLEALGLRADFSLDDEQVVA